jgi:cytochrome c-type biogenesis protein CcmH/NrfG
MARPCPTVRAGPCWGPSCSIIPAMRAASWAFMIFGFGIGLLGMNTLIKPRAAEWTKPIPQFVPQSAATSSVPPADPALIKRLEDQLKADPKNFEALRELGNLRYDERKYSEAAALYARALEVNPDSVDVRSDRGGALLQSEQIDEAIKELQMVLAKSPTHPQALFILGVALMEGKNDREGALVHWKKLVASHPDLPELDAVKRQIQQVEEQTRRK